MYWLWEFTDVFVTPCALIILFQVMKTLVQYVSSLLNTATENPCRVFC